MELEKWVIDLLAGKEQPLNIPQEKTNLGGMYLTDAVKSHTYWRDNWKNVVREHRTQECDAQTVSADNKCNVGKWIYGSGKRFEALPEYEQVKFSHEQFHLCAGEIVKLHNQGQFLDALTKSKNELMDLSGVVGLSLVSLLQAINAKEDRRWWWGRGE